MKVAHISYRPSDGVYKKILGQAKAAKKLGLDFEFIVISDDMSKEDEVIQFHRLILPKGKFLRKIALNFFQYKAISKSVDLTPYDRIILRYPSSIDLSYRGFFRKYKDKIITEHNSIMKTELKTLEVGWLNPLRIFLEHINSPKLLSEAAGIIGVTDEIRRFQLGLIKQTKPSTVISNGIDVEGIKFTKFKRFDNETLNMIFVSNTFYPWHGLDRLLEGLMEYEGDININLFLIGEIYRDEELRMINNMKRGKINIHALGKHQGDKLDHYYMNSNVAVSSLALFRINLNEACVLKTREYIARGIPFVYAYEDVDIPEDCRFALKFRDCDEPIDIQKLIGFVKDVSNRDHLSEKMREYASGNLDWKYKVTEMYKFASQT